MSCVDAASLLRSMDEQIQAAWNLLRPSPVVPAQSEEPRRPSQSANDAQAVESHAALTTPTVTAAPQISSETADATAAANTAIAAAAASSSRDRSVSLAKVAAAEIGVQTEGLEQGILPTFSAPQSAALTAIAELPKTPRSQKPLLTRAVSADPDAGDQARYATDM